MVFNSIEECIAYIESAIESCMKPLSDEIKKIMDEESYRQIRGWGGYLHRSVRSSSGGMSAEAYFSNEGNWYSLITGEKQENAIKFTESGSTWGRPASNIMEKALGTAEKQIPQKFLQLMRAKGVPIQ